MNLSSKLTALTAFFVILAIPIATKASIIINEIAWMGTDISANDEWIELYNATSSNIKIDGWVLQSKDKSPFITLQGTILANGYFLLERTDDNSAPGFKADQIYTGALSNSGEDLQLYDNEKKLIDEVDSAGKWFNGDNSTKQTMERKNPAILGSLAANWQLSQLPGGTPGIKNSTGSVTDTAKIKDEADLDLKTLRAGISKNKEEGAIPTNIDTPTQNINNTNTTSQKTNATVILLATAAFSSFVIFILKKFLTIPEKP